MDKVFGLVRPYVDAHTLGISYVEQLLLDCGYKTVVADRAVCEALNELDRPSSFNVLVQWIRTNRITNLGFSYRLDPVQAINVFLHFFYLINQARADSLPLPLVEKIYFAGLPAACDSINAKVGDRVPVFYGDETPVETLCKLGVSPDKFPPSLKTNSSYDDARYQFASEFIQLGQYQRFKAVDRSGYDGYGSFSDHICLRLNHSNKLKLPPLTRAHVGPYFQDRKEAIMLYLDWVNQLARDGFLDILSIGTSQLSQSNFGESWGNKPNGGGVPVNSEEELKAIWIAARPMLVRTYAGTKNIRKLAEIYELNINIAWHALSLWWFCKIDGRGPLDVRDNLNEHFDTLDYIARTDKPFEPNIPHHFSFRGGDDVTYIVSAVLAARAAKRRGIKYFVLQNMLNTPRFTSGIQDIAKSRTLLKLVRSLEDSTFRVIYQPRAGLDYFSHNLSKAKIQLASVTALMDDIDPLNHSSPDIIHVVSYSEASHLATPQIVKESIQITHASLAAYRGLQNSNQILNKCFEDQIHDRQVELLNECNLVINSMENTIENLYSPEGFYHAFRAGFLIAPYLWEQRDEFINATKWKTRVIDGAIRVVSETGQVLPTRDRVALAIDDYRSAYRKGSLSLNLGQR